MLWLIVKEYAQTKATIDVKGTFENGHSNNWYVAINPFLKNNVKEFWK